MLNPFPDLLVLGFFAPTILRIGVALAFGFVTYAHFSRWNELQKSLGTWIGLVILLEALVTVGLFLGAYTQIASLGAILLSLPQALYAKKYPRATPLCRAEYLFIILISLSLLLSGAGALALDLPL